MGIRPKECKLLFSTPLLFKHLLSFYKGHLLHPAHEILQEMVGKMHKVSGRYTGMQPLYFKEKKMCIS